MTPAGRLIILIGPKGCGKSYVGRLLEAELGIRFFHVEPLWMAYHETCRAAGRDPSIEEGIATVHPVIRAALRENELLCVETTGASRLILQDLLTSSVEPPLLARIRAPLEVCLRRIADRDPVDQIPLHEDDIRRVYELSTSLELPFDLELENVSLTDAQIVAAFQSKLDS